MKKTLFLVSMIAFLFFSCSEDNVVINVKKISLEEKTLFIQYSIKNLINREIWVLDATESSDGYYYKGTLIENKSDRKIEVDFSINGIPGNIDYEAGLSVRYRKTNPESSEDFQIKLLSNLKTDPSVYEKIVMRTGYYNSFPTRRYKSINDNVRVFNLLWQDNLDLKDKIVEIEIDIKSAKIEKIEFK